MAAAQAPGGWVRLAPVLFVLLWSSGFVGAKYGMPYAGPLTFLVWRMGLVILVLGGLMLATGASWPRQWRAVFHAAVAGLLLQGAYLGGVFTALAHGFPAGMVALIAGLQPLLTAALAPWLLGERISPRQWVGFALGFSGVVLVLWTKLVWTANFGDGLGLALFALLGVTFGTIYQKRFGTRMDLRASALVQYVATFVVLLPLAALTESMHVDWSWHFVGALAYLVVALSLGAVLLLLGLIRRGAAARVVSLFFLVPPATALIAYIVFGETFDLLAIGGMGLTAGGVALVNKG